MVTYTREAIAKMKPPRKAVLYKKSYSIQLSDCKTVVLSVICAGQSLMS